MTRQAGRPSLGWVNPQGPVNWAHPVNRGQVAWWTNLPGGQWGGARTWRTVRRALSIDGTLTNGPAWGGPLGRPGGYGSIALDGTDDYIVAGPHTALDVTTGSLACWVRLVTNKSYNIFVDNIQSFASLRNGYTLYANSSGSVFLELGSASAFQEVAFGGGNVLVVGTWYHLIATWDGSRVRLYQNGIPRTDVAQTLTPSFTGTALHMGRTTAGDSSRLSGSLDGVRIYNHGLSPDLARALYDEERAGCQGALRWLARRVYYVPPPVAEGIGLEFTLPQSRLHYTLPESRLHYTLPRDSNP